MLIENCDKCGIELVPSFPDRMRRRGDFPNYQNALVIDLNGGYGMLIDPMGQGDRFILCQDCGKEFILANRWLVTENSDFLLGEDNG